MLAQAATLLVIPAPSQLPPFRTTILPASTTTPPEKMTTTLGGGRRQVTVRPESPAASPAIDHVEKALGHLANTPSTRAGRPVAGGLSVKVCWAGLFCESGVHRGIPATWFSMSSRQLILLGVGNMLGDVYDCASALGITISTIVTNTPEEIRSRTKGLVARLADLGERPAIVPLEAFPAETESDCFVVPTTPRKTALISQLAVSHPRLCYATLVHPRAYVSPYATVGPGVFVGAGSVIAAGAVLGPHVFVNRCVNVGHDTVVHEYGRLQPGSSIGGHVTIHAGVTIGIGANIIEELVIGTGAVVAAGATVITDVAPLTMVAGVPARWKKQVD